jgi:ABC-type cobalt transport system substrate-binding protein
VKKRYASPFALVVYLNISEYGIAQAETEQAIANIKVKYGASFKDLWILWKGKLY